MNIWLPISMLCLVIALAAAGIMLRMEEAMLFDCGADVPKNEQRVQPKTRYM